MLEQARIETEASLFRHNMPEKFPFTHLAGCRLLCELGRGGMGVVFQGRHATSGHIVAIKMLPWRTSIVPEWMQKFQSEARIAAEIRNPNLVPVFQCGEEHGYIYYTMQFVNGVGLDRLITRLQHTTHVVFADEIQLMHRSRPAGFIIPDSTAGTSPAAKPGSRAGTADLGQASRGQPVREALPAQDARNESARSQLSRFSWTGFARIAVQTARALRSAHAAGIIHNDIKPGNLLIDEIGHVWVTDFGLSQPFDPVSMSVSAAASDSKHGSGRLSAGGLYGMRHRSDAGKSSDDSGQRIAGTLRYMSPERLLGHPPDIRSDIYSLGVTLYELSVQQQAFPMTDRDQLLEAILDHVPPLPSTLRKDFPRGLETIIQNCIARNPDDRYATTEALLADLLRFSGGKSIAAVRPTLVGGLLRALHKKIAGGRPEE